MSDRVELVDNRPDPVAVQRTYDQFVREHPEHDPCAQALHLLRERSKYLSMLIIMLEAERDNGPR